MKCPVCDAKMFKMDTLSKTFNVDGRKLLISHLSGYHCRCCNNDIFESYDNTLVGKIAHVLHNDILNGYLTVNEVMQFTKWSRAKVYYQLYNDKFSGAFKLDNRWKIPRKSLIDMGFDLSNSEEKDIISEE